MSNDTHAIFEAIRSSYYQRGTLVYLDGYGIEVTPSRSINLWSLTPQFRKASYLRGMEIPENCHDLNGYFMNVAQTFVQEMF